MGSFFFNFSPKTLFFLALEKFIFVSRYYPHFLYFFGPPLTFFLCKIKNIIK